jgi:hypothetical protein
MWPFLIAQHLLPFQVDALQATPASSHALGCGGRQKPKGQRVTTSILENLLISSDLHLQTTPSDPLAASTSFLEESVKPSNRSCHLYKCWSASTRSQIVPCRYICKHIFQRAVIKLASVRNNHWARIWSLEHTRSWAQYTSRNLIMFGKLY